MATLKTASRELDSFKSLLCAEMELKASALITDMQNKIGAELAGAVGQLQETNRRAATKDFAEAEQALRESAAALQTQQEQLVDQLVESKTALLERRVQELMDRLERSADALERSAETLIKHEMPLRVRAMMDLEVAAARSALGRERLGAEESDEWKGWKL